MEYSTSQILLDLEYVKDLLDTQNEKEEIHRIQSTINKFQRGVLYFVDKEYQMSRDYFYYCCEYLKYIESQNKNAMKLVKTLFTRIAELNQEACSHLR